MQNGTDSAGLAQWLSIKACQPGGRCSAVLCFRKWQVFTCRRKVSKFTETGVRTCVWWLFCSTSGAMYCRVPTMRCLWKPPDGAAATLVPCRLTRSSESPKSARWALSWASISTLPALMSLCTSPAPCTHATAEARRAASIRTAPQEGRHPSSCTLACTHALDE